MSLVATLSAPGADAIALEASELTFERRVGGAVRLRVFAHVSRDDEEDVAKVLQASSTTVEVTWQGSNQHIPDRKLLPPCQVVGAHWHDSATRELLIAAVHTVLRSPAQDLLEPKWRVHRKSSLGELLRGFPDVVKLSDGAAYALDQVSFPPGDHSCIVQAGMSDWEFVQEALRRYGHHKQDARAENIVLTGGVDGKRETLGRWVAMFAGKSSYDEQNDIDGRVVQLPGDVSDVTYDFGAIHAADLVPQMPLGAMAEVVLSYLNSSMRDWTQWCARDLPLFTSERRMIWRTGDRLTRTGDNVAWRSALHILPEGSAVPIAERAYGPRPWTATGTVQKCSPADPWMTVALPAPFANGESQIDACLTTMYSGKDGKTGLHLVPEENTQVLLHWSGVFGEPVFVIGNVRVDATKHAAPSLALEKSLTMSLQKVAVEDVGAIHTKSALDLSVDKTTSLKSTGALELSGEQATAKFSGTTLKVGQ